MSLSRWLDRRMDRIMLVSSTFALCVTLPRETLVRWQRHVERVSVEACVRNGGVALTARDGIVSCAPRTVTWSGP